MACSQQAISAQKPRRPGWVPFNATSVESPIEYFVDQPGCQRDQDQVSTHLLPFVTIVTRELAEQTPVQLFRNTRWKRFATRQVFLDARWQSRAGAPVVPGPTDDPQDAASIDAWAMVPIIAPGVLAFVAMATLFPLAWAVPLAITIAGIGQYHR